MATLSPPGLSPLYTPQEAANYLRTIEASTGRSKSPASAASGGRIHAGQNRRPSTPCST
jgi:hypothetical protein